MFSPAAATLKRKCENSDSSSNEDDDSISSILQRKIFMKWWMVIHEHNVISCTCKKKELCKTCIFIFVYSNEWTSVINFNVFKFTLTVKSVYFVAYSQSTLCCKNDLLELNQPILWNIFNPLKWFSFMIFNISVTKKIWNTSLHRPYENMGDIFLLTHVNMLFCTIIEMVSINSLFYQCWLWTYNYVLSITLSLLVLSTEAST